LNCAKARELATYFIRHKVRLLGRRVIMNLLSPGLQILYLLWREEVTDNEIAILLEEGTLLRGDHCSGKGGVDVSRSSM